MSNLSDADRRPLCPMCGGDTALAITYESAGRALDALEDSGYFADCGKPDQPITVDKAKAFLACVLGKRIRVTWTFTEVSKEVYERPGWGTSTRPVMKRRFLVTAG